MALRTVEELKEKWGSIKRIHGTSIKEDPKKIGGGNPTPPATECVAVVGQVGEKSATLNGLDGEFCLFFWRKIDQSFVLTQSTAKVTSGRFE